MTPEDLNAVVDAFYEALEGSEMVAAYHERHGTQSLGILTVLDDEHAANLVDYLRERIAGKVVIEIGAGIGLLALHMGEVASRVYAIDSDPAWTTSFVGALYTKKPRHVTWIFGAAEEMIGQLRGDVAVIVTHSGHAAMRAVAAQLAPVVIDVHEELVGSTAYVRGESA